MAKKIHAGCRVVFVTAYDLYAVETFEAKAVDYLLKPVEPERLAHTVKRLKKQIVDDPAPGQPLPESILKLKKISETLTVSRSYAYLFKQM